MRLPVAVTITGIEKPEVLEQDPRIAPGFKPLTEPEMEAVRTKCRQMAGDARFELYKVSLRYDNPQSRMPHGFPLDEKQKEL